MNSLSAVLETAVYCRDLAAARHFYSTVLGLTEYSELEGEYLFYRIGQGMFLVFNPEKSQRKNLSGATDQPPGHGCRGGGHMAFTIDHQELEYWESRLREHHVHIESRVDWPGGGKSIYFRDPGNNSIELATADIWSS